MQGQMNIFDYMPTLRTEPPVGTFITEPGATICHIMIPGYIGKKVAYDVSTESRTLYKVGILEKYIPYEGRMRAIIYDGKQQRALVTLYPGKAIYEVLPWDSYPERNKAIGYRREKNET